MREQKITVPTVGSSPGFTAVQIYAYDSLNRIQSATETISSTQTWKQTFNYDRYGNRRFDPANTTTLGTCQQQVCNPTISTLNNRFSSGQGYSYDAAGAVTQDAEGKQFLYDAESHQKEVKDSLNNSLGQYFYDGEGTFAKKHETFTTLGEIGPGYRGTYVILKPNETYVSERSIDLKDEFFDTVDKCTLVISYGQFIDSYHEGIKVWKGLAESNQLIFDGLRGSKPRAE